VSTNGAAVGRPMPWRIGDLWALWVPLVAGAVLLLLSWWGTSATVNLSTQIVWLNVGVCGVMVGGAGIVVWLMTGRRAIGERRRRLLPEVVVARMVAAGVDVPTASDDLVTGVRMTRYHRADCPMVAGKTIRRASGVQARSAGLAPCGVCRPDA
jgi:hypothetical protein